MRFAPQSEAEVQKSASKFGPWPNGIYDFEISEATEKVSAKGNDMIALTITVHNDSGETRTVFDYLLESIPHKLKHAAESCGLHARYEDGTLSDNDFYGKTGRLKLGIQAERDGYPAKNVVKDYIPVARKQEPAAARTTPARRPALATAGAGSARDLDDEIPF